MRVSAFDQGMPVRSANVPIRITIKRNQYPPEFQGAPYKQTVSENVINGTGIFTVRATDRDPQVS